MRVPIDTNRDGIDLDRCKNVRISNTTVNSPNDDAIVLKSRRVAADLATRGLTRRRVVALAVRLIDRGLFRVGSDRYATGKVAEELGNTPAVARASYVDPRVVELYQRGRTVALPATASDAGPTAEGAARRLLKG